MTSALQTAPSIRFRDVHRAEVTKIMTHPATWIAFGTAGILNTGLGILDSTEVIRIAAGDRIVRLSDLGSVLLAPVYAFVITAVFAAGSEYQNGQLRVTLAAAPARGRLLVAKLAALLTVIVPAALIATAPGRLISALTLDQVPDAGSIISDVLSWCVVYTVLSIVAFGLGILLRGVAAPLALMTLIPLLAWTGVFQLPEIIRLLPHDASLSLLGLPASAATELSPHLAGLTLLAWTVIATVAAATVFTRRDS
jgi:ABC-2 type transport system permease protein